jgi:hypothetical protein
MKIAIVFATPQTVQFQVIEGRLGKVAAKQNRQRWVIEVLDAKLGPGAPATRVTVRTKTAGFTFWIRQVTATWPIWIPHYGVAVVPADDARTYQEIADDIRGRGLQNELDRIASEPEESFAAAAAVTRDLNCETWLGLSRDMRIFRINFDARQGFLGFFQRKNAGLGSGEWGKDEIGEECEIFVGRGATCRVDVRRWLEDGSLPILHAEQRDADMVYRMTTFVTLEKSALTAKNLRGTHYLVADDRCIGRMHLPKEQEFVKAHMATEKAGGGEQTVLLIRVEAINTGTTPHYAFLSTLAPRSRADWKHDGVTGYGLRNDGMVMGISRLDGQPMPQHEIAVLLQPGEKTTLEVAMPHEPLPVKRARALSKFDFDKRRDECRAFWQAKLAAVSSIRLPERRIEEMVRAGLLHLDLITYGLEPSGPTAATIGFYSPIGSESSPIIQFYDSVGWHSLAERSLQFFLDKQHENGFIQNYGGYMLETGGALWSMGEHYRYTRDKAWLRRVQPNMLKACEFLLAWRERNKTPQGMGLIEGKCADPEDPFRQFMLNGFAYVGMQRVGEMLAELNPKAAKRWTAEAAAWRADIRKSVELVMSESPVIPLGDGTWTLTCPAWAEGRGPAALHVDGSSSNSHATIGCRDSLLGPLYLILQEVVDANEWMGECLLKSHHELFTLRNAGFSQPYYCRHDLAHLRRGEPAAFLKTYFNQVASLADRQTYTFWEHFFGASPHKTHEEAWFLMQTRWMLWLEDGTTLRLLSAVPRAWLEHGQEIKLEKVASYFGKFSLTVRSQVQSGRIEAEVKFHESGRKPGKVVLRLPHPLGLKAVRCTGGKYDAQTETVVTTGKVVLEF